MKVLHIAGGFAQHPLYSQLIRHLHAIGHHQTIFAPVRSTAELSRQPPDEVDTLEYKFRHILKPVHRILFRTKIRTIYRELVECVDPAQFDLVHAHTLFSDGAAALRLHQRFDIPYVVAVRNTDLNFFMRFRPDLRRILRSVLSGASRVVFLSPAYRRAFLLRLQPDLREIVEEKSIVLGNGINSFWLEDHPTPVRDSSTPLRVLYVGEFSQNKNVDSILHATAALEKRVPVQLTLVGDGGRTENRIRTAIDNGKYPFAKFLGRVHNRGELRSIYRDHDIFVMPSFRETFGVVYIEALSQGLPIVHSRGQGVDGFFPPGTVSEAVDPYSVESIAAGIESVAARLEQVRPVCTSTAREFSWEAIALQYEELYRIISDR